MSTLQETFSLITTKVTSKHNSFEIVDSLCRALIFTIEANYNKDKHTCDKCIRKNFQNN